MSDEAPTLVHALLARAAATPEAPAFRTLPSGGAPAEEVWSWARWADEARALATALQAEGLEAGDRVAVLAAAHPVWPLTDLAVQWAGMVSVGLYPTSAPAQVREILDDAGARALVVDGSEQLAKVRGVLDELPELRLVVAPEEALEGDGMEPLARSGTLRVRSWESLLATEADPALDVRLPDPDADAVLIYTSGSTGRPKGARLAHRTLVASARSVRDALGRGPGDRSLSFLPYCHAAERVFGLATRLVVGEEAGLVPDPARVFEAAAAFRPTVFGGLPRLYEKVYEAHLADRAAPEPPEEEATTRLLGGAVRLATSGGAALPVEVAETLRSVGLTVLGAYGLTEHLCAAFNRPGDPTFDTAGPPMPGTEIRIADDGEILLRRCDLTFLGYHGRPEATERAFTPDGAWLRTGDLGELDGAGRLRVTGRKKELLALSTGKKVAPLRIEGWLVEQPWIDGAMLVGEGRKYVTALLTLRRPVVEAWARREGLEERWPELARHPRVRDEVAAQVEAVNDRVSRTESVRRFHLLPEPFSAEAGEVTPTHKLRRDVVARRHARAIQALYPEGPA